MDDLGYRRPQVPELYSNEKPSSEDAANYSTLKEVQAIIDKNLFDLEKNFNSFNVLNQPDPDVTVRKLLIDIESRQLAYLIIANLKATVDAAISKSKSI